MTYDLEHGITLVEDPLLCQELDINSTVETTTVLGMVGSRAQVKRVWTHSEKNAGSVKGNGPINITPGVGDAGVEGIGGGVTVIESLKYKQAITSASEWEYAWAHYPHAEAA